MKRYHEELPRIRREHRLHLRHIHNWPYEPVHCICNLQAGRFRKRHGRGCSKSRCHLCKYEKIYQIPTARTQRQNQQADSDLWEWWVAQQAISVKKQ